MTLNLPVIFRIGTIVGLIVLIVIWISAGVLKIIQPSASETLIYSFIPSAPTLFVSMVVSVGEIATGLSLIYRKTRSAGLYVSTFFALGFVMISLWAELKGLSIPCGCFGSGNSLTIGFSTLPLQISLVLLSILILVTQTIERKTPSA